MICTKKEAQDKWCPLAQLSAEQASADKGIQNCVADNCMMWCPINNQVDTGMCGLTISMQMGVNVNCRKDSQ